MSEGEVACESVVADLLNRITRLSSLNAFIEVYAEEALHKAREIDRKVREGRPLGRLYGVVIGVKDVICH